MLKELSGCKEFGSEFVAGAPLGIVVIADPKVCDVSVEDASIASIMIRLLAQSLDLASCWIQVRERFHSGEVKAEDYINGVLGIPEKYSIECIVAIGYSAEEKGTYGDNELLYDKIHINRF